MITKDQMLQLFEELNTELKQNDVTGEICIVGGAAMTLAFNARVATHDVDAVFDPKTDVQISAIDVGKRHGLDVDWLNDAVKGFMPGVQPKHKKILLNLSNLKVWAPDASYLLAMKSISARPTDIRDIKFLIKKLNLTTAKEVFEIIKHYYPKGEISKKSMNLLLSIFEE